MDQRRQMLSALVAVTLFFGWMQVAPILFPDWFPQPPNKNKNLALQPLDPERKDGEAADKDTPELKPDSNAPDQQPTEENPQPADFPARTVTLGDAGLDAGYLLKVELTTQGGAINGVWLNDPRYTTLDRKSQVRLVGNDVIRNVGAGPIPKTFDTSIPQINEALAKHGLTLDAVNWEIVSQDAEKVTFRYPSPAGDLEVIKTYTLPKVNPANRDTDVAGYMLDVTLTIRNLSSKEVRTEYFLQGPVGVPLENVENTRLFREIKLGTFDNPRSEKITYTNLLASALVKQFDKSQRPGGKAIPDWRAPLLFAGIDEQYFAALVFPQRDAEAKQGNPIAVTKPQLLYLDRKRPDLSDMSIVMQSSDLSVPAEGDVVNEFKVFFGPKRPALLSELNAEPIIQLGWFAFVSKIMLMVLGFFHSLGLPYALAIIALTVVVRLGMMPISKKQAIEAEKMRILAPKMKEMQERYKGQPEEFARAYREFQKKHNYQPLMGCLPALIQLPIFLGLYNSLYHAVDLRLAKFLWIDNLAAPDAIAQLPFRIPLLGWTELNLLPFITVALFVVQQKLFTPPPTSEEQAMQYRMMNFMMIFIGFMFYHVPSGLCLYFIASSLWGITERLYLKKSLATHQLALAEAVAEDPADVKPQIVDSVPRSAKKAGAAATSTTKAPTWWDKLREAADQAKNATEGQQSQRKFTKGKNQGGKGSKPRR
jgi:membrane protein insertase, YidC/Oxa1 family, N-terminal domain